MLTLFPRIKPNPLPPPPLPAEPLEAKPGLVEPAVDVVPAVIETANNASNLREAAAIAIAPAEAPQPAATDTTTPASSVTDSDLFAAFMSGMATAGSDPFVVEITAQSSSKTTPELSESEHRPAHPASLSSSSESSAAVGEVSAAPPESVETNAPQSQIAPEHIADALRASENPGDASPAPQLYIAAANIFDELDILHEAAAAPVESAAPEPRESMLAPGPDRASESPSGSVIEAAKAAPKATPTENGATAAEPTPDSDAQTPTTEIAATEIAASIASEISDESAQAQVNAEDPNPAESQPAIDASEPESASVETASPEASPVPQELATPQQAQQVQPTEEEQPETSSDLPSSKEAQSLAPVSREQEAVAATPEPLAEPAKKAAFDAQLSPPKPKRAKGTFGGLARVPEPEAMEDAGEVEAYSSAAAQSHLDAIDDTFVAHAQLLLKGRERGRALDIGTGPGQIVIKLGYRLTLWKFIGIDRSAAMIEKARESLATASELAGRVEFRVADGNALDVPDKTFDLVVCNSVLHHIAEPQKLFTEIVRVVKPGGAILLRDLRRPSRWGYSYHVWKHGKYYEGEMRRLFMASVMAAYTEEELQRLIASSALRDVHVFHHAKTHIGFERPVAGTAERKR